MLFNFSFRGRILENGKVRGRRRDTWLEDDVMTIIWVEGIRYMPRATRKHWLEAYWQFPVMAVMYGVNFFWYNEEVGETVACINIKVGRTYEDKTLIKKDTVKPKTMFIGSL